MLIKIIKPIIKTAQKEEPGQPEQGCSDKYYLDCLPAHMYFCTAKQCYLPMWESLPVCLWINCKADIIQRGVQTKTLISEDLLPQSSPDGPSPNGPSILWLVPISTALKLQIQILWCSKPEN